MADDLQIPISHPFRHVLAKIVESIHAWENGVAEHRRNHKKLEEEAQRKFNQAADEHQRTLYAEAQAAEYRAAFKKVLAHD